MALKKGNTAETVVEEETTASEQSVVEDVLEPESEVEQSTEVAVPPAAQLPANPTGKSATTAKLAEEGYEGLQIDWTSFPTIVLDKGEFCSGDGTELAKQDVLIRIMQTRKRFVLRTKTAEPDDAELAYTYDMSELANPESDIAIKVAGWKAEGLDYVVKEYIEAVGMVEDPDHQFDQQMVLLQIPPTSVGRFSGYMTSNQLVKKLLPREYLTRCYRGDKITKANNPFYPWAFEFVG